MSITSQKTPVTIFFQSLVLSTQFRNMLKNSKWRQIKLDHFRLTLRVSYPLSNDNLAPADHGNHYFHASFTWYPVPLFQQSSVNPVNNGHGWFPVSNSKVELVTKVLDGVQSLETSSATED